MISSWGDGKIYVEDITEYEHQMSDSIRRLHYVPVLVKNTKTGKTRIYKYIPLKEATRILRQAMSRLNHKINFRHRSDKEVKV
jgi:hypothetical protein